jgi:hypothetical protein
MMAKEKNRNNAIFSSLSHRNLYNMLANHLADDGFEPFSGGKPLANSKFVECGMLDWEMSFIDIEKLFSFSTFSTGMEWNVEMEKCLKIGIESHEEQTKAIEQGWFVSTMMCD